MSEITEIEIVTADGSMNCHTIRPDTDTDPKPVIVYMPASGIRDELVGIAGRIANLGYFVVLPNLFYRLARHCDIDANRLGNADYAPVATYMSALAANLTNARVIADSGAILDYLDRQPDVNSSKVGGVGYCMGGRLVMATIGAHADRMVAAASLYGAGIVSDEPDSPHHALHRVTGELYFGLADNDKYVTDEETAALRAHMATLDVEHEIEHFPDTEHGFVFPERYCFAPAATELHYERLAALFGRRLS